jgi:hypothetical protein
MIKYTITAECEDEFDKNAILDAVKNKLAIEQLYDEVFRPVIKYSDDPDKINSYTEVWEKVYKYLEDSDVKL